MEDGVLGLRQRKKLNLRQRLVDTAIRLFAKNGFEKTALDQISGAHEVHTRTLLRYFNSKEELALAPAYAGYERFTAMLADARRHGGPAECWRQYVQDYWLTFSDDPKVAMRYLSLLSEVPSLRAMVLDLDRKFEAALAGAISDAAGTHVEDDIYAQLLAANLVHGARSVGLLYQRSAGMNEIVAKVVAVIDLTERIFPSRELVERAWVPPGSIELSKMGQTRSRRGKPAR